MGKITIPNTVPSQPQYQQGENYVLHDPNITQYPAYYKELLAGAKQSIKILDPYASYGNDSIRVFEAVRCDDITIEIYMTGHDKTEINTFSDGIKNIIENKLQHYTLKIFAFKESGIRKEQRIPLWHDRYLVIDDKDFYLIGSSVDAQQKSLKYHGIYHLVKPKDIEIVENIFMSYRKAYNSIRGFKTERRKKS